MTEHEDDRPELRSHAYITTFTGARFSYRNPGPFLLRDIAHSLSYTARFRGHTGFFYSVAQHSLMVADLMRYDGYSPAAQAAGLLHDAHEAYVGDIPTPLKWACPEIADLEGTIAGELRAALLPCFPGFVFDVVKRYDTLVLHLEASALFEQIPAWVVVPKLPGPFPVVSMAPIEAEQRFLDRAAVLGIA
jgi:hypothetical protein